MARQAALQEVQEEQAVATATKVAAAEVLVTVAPAFLPDDNPLMQGGNPFQAPP